MSKLVEFPLEQGGSITVQVTETPTGRVTRGGREGPGEAVDRAGQTLEQALDGIGPTAAAIVQKLREGVASPGEVEVSFGVSLKTEAGAVIAKVGGEANFSVTARWHHETAS